MQEKSCRCGASKKRFKYDIGQFFIAECCEAKGYDAKGNLKDGAPKPAPAPTPVKVQAPTPKVEEPKEEAPEPEADEPQEEVTPGPNEGEAPEEAPGETSALKAFFGIGRAGGRGKLMDMKIEDLKVKAKEKGIQGADQMTKKQLVAAILG